MSWSYALTRGAKIFALGAALTIVLSGESRAQSAVPDNYIVTLKKGISPAAVARDHKLAPKFLYTTALNGFAGVIPASKLRSLQRDGRVLRVEADRVVHAVVGTADGGANRKPGSGGGGGGGGQTLPWGIDRVDADISSMRAGDGSGAVEADIAVIDTGIQPDHPDLNVVGGVNFSNGSSWSDGNGHGTHVAGTAAARDNATGVVGVAPGARLHAVRVLNNAGSGTWQGVISGINWVAARASTIEVANMSLGGPANDSVDEAVRSAIAAGVTFALAAGNEDVDASTTSPARVEEAITVAASDINNVSASWSNWGEVVDLIAPGVDIRSTWKGGGYKTISGTSMASPHAAGAAALYISGHAGATPAQVRGALFDAANATGGTKIQRTEGEVTYTYGLLNVAGF